MQCISREKPIPVTPPILSNIKNPKCIVGSLVARFFLRTQIDRRVCASGGGRGRSFVGLSRGFGGSSIAPRLRSHHFQIRSFWTASVEHANVHPVVFLTPRAFYSDVSGLLRDSVSRSSLRSRLLVYLFALQLSSTENPRLHISLPFLSCPKP